jgi:cellulose synthase/poly-beta-1,6-N-acetylglucosamine synthase-like glycosyltransferase
MMYNASVILFWCSAIFVAYSFAGYPMLLVFVSLFHRREVRRASIVPRVTLIVPAHNEAKIIGSKIENCLTLDYPREKLEIIVASDASQDETNDIVKSFAHRGVQLISTQERHGNHYVQMLARDSSVGEILVFTDAGVQLPADSLHQIVSNFADPTVGCVSSEDEVVGQNKGQGEGVYVRVEMWLRRL